MLLDKQKNFQIIFASFYHLKIKKMEKVVKGKLDKTQYTVDGREIVS